MRVLETSSIEDPAANLPVCRFDANPKDHSDIWVMGQVKWKAKANEIKIKAREATEKLISYHHLNNRNS